MSDQFGPGDRLQGEEQTQTAQPNGEEQTETVQCNAGSCSVTVNAPHFALAFHDNRDPVESTETWPTSIATKLGCPTVFGPSVLATSNGRGGAQEVFNIGGTTSGSQV